MTRRQLVHAVVAAAAVCVAVATIRAAYDIGHVVGRTQVLGAVLRRRGVLAAFDVVDELAGEVGHS